MTNRPIEELAVPYDGSEAAAKVQRRKRLVRGRVISLVITVVIMVVIYVWQREQFDGAGLWVLYGVVLAVSVGWLAVYLVGYRIASAELAEVGDGIALRIGRAGVEVAGLAAGWSGVRSLGAVKAGLGRSPRLRLETSDGSSASVALDQIPVLPATLDTTARAYSAGRWGVDLQALDN